MPPSLPNSEPDPAIAGDTTRDGFLDGKITIIQPKSGPRGAIDALFLAASVPAKAGERALDMGAGTGIVGIAMAWRVPGLDVTCIERQADLCGLAEENLTINGLADRARIVRADITAPASSLQSDGLMLESFHHLAANPPFFVEGAARTPREPAKAQSHIAKPGAFAAWIRFAAAMAAPRGTLTLIHRPEALSDILTEMEGRFGGLKVLALYPARGEQASRIIVQGTKGSKAPLQLHDGLVLHEAGGRYTPRADAVLREGRTLELAG